MNYILHFLYYGYDEEIESNDLNKLIKKSREMIEENSGKPLIIKNNKDEIVREYSPRLFNFNIPKYSSDFKPYKESLVEMGEIE